MELIALYHAVNDHLNLKNATDKFKISMKPRIQEKRMEKRITLENMQKLQLLHLW